MANAQQIVAMFQSLTIQEQREFFRAVSKEMNFPTVVRDVAEKAAAELEDYLDFHGQPYVA